MSGKGHQKRRAERRHGVAPPPIGTAQISADAVAFVLTETAAAVRGHGGVVDVPWVVWKFFPMIEGMLYEAARDEMFAHRRRELSGGNGGAGA